MTTNYQILSTVNVFCENEVLMLSQEECYADLEIAAIAFVSESPNVRENHIWLGQIALSELMHKYECWLLACHTAWQTDNRISRYYKLWKSLIQGRIELPNGVMGKEEMVESIEGIKYFGAINFLEADFTKAMDVVHDELASHIVLLPKGSSNTVLSLIPTGWTRASFGPSPEILLKVIKADGIVFWPYGAFDDRPSGMCLLGKPNTIQNFKNRR